MFTMGIPLTSVMNLEKVKKVKASKPFTILDCIILVAVLAAIGIGFWCITRRQAVTVVVTTPQKTYELALDKDAVLVLDGLTVHVKDGKVWVENADCPDKTCERRGAISSFGQSIVCLPNGIAVRVQGDGDLAWEVG